MLKLDLEAVVEDASDEVYSFQILKSLIYWKFEGLYISRSQYTISESDLYPVIVTPWMHPQHAY